VKLIPAAGIAAVMVVVTALTEAAPSAPLRRVPNTTLALPPQPPAFGFRTEVAFPGVTFVNPLAIVSPPGESNRLFIVEQAGRIVVLTDLASPTRTVFLDLTARVTGGTPPNEEGLLGLAFHPEYAQNRTFFVFYTLNTQTAAGSGRHNRLSRFETSATDPNQALPDSETPLITQRDEASNHNGGDLHFGPDGYLYVSLGDEGGANDQYNNSQRIDKDFFAGLLRIDVDKRPGSLPPNPHAAATDNYAIPPDNPFVGATSFNGRAVDPVKVRTEFWAVGLRNPWRLTFDSATGALYCADVGQDRVEEIDLIVKGGNYGWSYREGTRNGPRTAPADFTSIAPVLEYQHGSGSFRGDSVTGGVVYRGARLSQLYGAYVFADYVRGNLWALRQEGGIVTSWERLTGDTSIAGFGIDPRNGDILTADLDQDTIKRLVYDATPTGAPLPPTLADTGAFADLKTLTPNAGIVPYELNVPFWSDHAHKTRWFSVPDVNQTIGFRPTGNWSFPTGTVWIKHFELELVKDVPASRRRLETRFIVRNTNGVYGIVYRWNDEQTNATLVPEEGLDETFEIREDETVRTQTWHYPSRAECVACHTAVGGGALGFNTPQLNRPFDFGGTVENQIRALSLAGYLSGEVANLSTLPALAPASETAVSLEWRVRSYLAANCAQCHQPGGPALGFWDARISTPTALAGLLNGVLREGHSAEVVIKPGAPEQSELYERLAEWGTHHMPPLATSELNQEAIDLLARWITKDLPSNQNYTDWQTAKFGSTTDPKAAPDADPDADGAPNELEYLTGTDPLKPGDGFKAAIEQSPGGVQIVFPQLANRAFEVQFTDNLSATPVWQPLDVPANRPVFAATPTTGRVLDVPAPDTSRYYRVHVRAP
jgi:uncharacterized repeat protein (TIGR03806 family)